MFSPCEIERRSVDQPALVGQFVEFIMGVKSLSRMRLWAKLLQ